MRVQGLKELSEKAQEYLEDYPEKDWLHESVREKITDLKQIYDKVIASIVYGNTPYTRSKNWGNPQPMTWEYTRSIEIYNRILHFRRQLLEMEKLQKKT